ncbi:MAG: hypothetical protein HN534_06110 [Euryarchaeota archaeon]|jgi:hypothetical protein|nr:hypothetical protein [Euryarchaeota archaeon]MBT3757966.1 hypothetical protein [Euryarchaeota archaeon]MBT4050810.1 hypothetical protein [Euryarchaeota archaeon]MBT4346316.1 hypothetical protein [Euryarchaeota archaeon]MBT4650840.1 hypothetical protein [Euryarchaeota archaeon]
MVPADASGEAQFTDKQWTIMAAIIGMNTGYLLFHGLSLEGADNPFLKVVGLTIIAIALPFQGIYFMIHTFVQEHPNRIMDSEFKVLNMISGICQLVSYLSLSGVFLILYNTHHVIGASFAVSAFVALLLVRTAMANAAALERL